MTFVNFGCGLSVVKGWRNFDASPTLRLQRMPALGFLFSKFGNPQFPAGVQYGDVSRRLPLSDEQAQLVYCSHVLEHLSLMDLRKCLNEMQRIMVSGSVFRGVLPDLESCVTQYLLDSSADRCSNLMRSTLLGTVARPSGFMQRLRASIGNSNHLWMWDYRGMEAELQRSGFVDIRPAVMGDSSRREFDALEDPDRWSGELGFECLKA